MSSHWSRDDMTIAEAKDFLTHYLCCCPYGNSPVNCGDKACAFGKAIRVLCDKETEHETDN